MWERIVPGIWDAERVGWDWKPVDSITSLAHLILKNKVSSG